MGDHSHNHGDGKGHGLANVQDDLKGRAHRSGHDHGGHAGHAHPPMQPSVLAWAMAATLGLVVAEIFGGLLGRSVALLNDARSEERRVGKEWRTRWGACL